MKKITHKRFWLVGIFTFALFACFIYGFQADPIVQYSGGGDSGLYLQIGRDFVGGLDYSGIPIPVPPVYLLIVGIPQQVLSPAHSIYFVWILQSLIVSLSCLLVFGIGAQLAQDERVGLVAAIALASSRVFIFEALIIQTEAVFIFFVILATWLYIVGFTNEQHSKLRQQLCLYLAAIILGLAALTRPVLILFPVGLAIHLLIIKRWRSILPFLAAYAFILFSWTAYTSLYYEWTVVGSNQLFPAIWRGAVENDGSPRENDQLLGDQTALEQTSEIITSEPLAFVQRRIVELSAAYLQPHGTISLGRESLKALGLRWVNTGFSANGFADLINSEHFFTKLIIYIWHYVALIGGVIGMWLSRKNWRVSLVLVGYIAYTTLLHVVALAIPRYIFPTFPFFWIFAAVSLIALWDVMRGKEMRQI